MRDDKFRSVVQHSPVGILLVGSKGELIHMNPKAETIFGYSNLELVGKPMEVLLPERFRNRHHQLRNGYTQNPEPRPMGSGRELFGLRKDGQEIAVEIGLVPIPHEHGVDTLATIIDVSEKKRLEQDVLHVVEMEQKRIARDLHDSLGQQLLATSLLCNVLKKKANAQKREDVAEIGQIEDMLNKIKLNVRRISRGLFAADLESHGLKNALEELVSYFQETSSMQFEFICPEELPILPARVLENIFRFIQEAVSNAVTHSSAKKVILKIVDTPPHLEVQVKDDGVGISEEALKGLRGGLGLRTLKYRSNVMRGQFEISSRPNEGALIFCRIPYAH